MPVASSSRRTFLIAFASSAVMTAAAAAGERVADSTAVAERVRRLLNTASKGREWTTGRGVRRWPIIIAGEQQGTLWEDVDPRTLGIGDHWEAGSGLRVELVHNSRVVGMLRLNHE
ncbi:MAG: hypothetical protein Q8O26_14240 [Phreatobacter sp.]|uniref:hypothetical protein n=1 Tax=Phreatobacter sp. TaxID=1966341 RepID=UPI002732C5CD|nr:hypothetical protein [Phreatobacter sp.]MDP2803032.1 hypothetical protein [Phreatobacter sp.]